jgi:hemolysin-activating ACP:hemolysin acyltransferase
MLKEKDFYYLEKMVATLRYTKLISPILIVLVFAACESDYTKMVKSELAKGVRQDSILLGIRLGETRHDFYGQCYDLNRQQLVTAGEGGTVQYMLTDSTVHASPTTMKILFVPAFDNKQVLTNLDLKITYVSWAPWNRQFQADSLESKLKQLLTKWYGGNEFVIAKIGEEKIPVKVDGNRRIVLYRKEPQTVVVKVQDILHPKFKHSKVKV